MRKIGLGRALVLLGIFVECIGLMLYGLEIVPRGVFRAIVLAGVMIDLAALVVILKRSEF